MFNNRHFSIKSSNLSLNFVSLHSVTSDTLKLNGLITYYLIIEKVSDVRILNERIVLI